MVRFLIDLLSRAFWDSLASVGGTPGAIIISLVLAFVTAFLVWKFRGREAFMEHFKANILITFAGVFLTWVLVFLWTLLRMPQAIRQEAGTLPVPVPITRSVLPPSGWDTKTPKAPTRLLPLIKSGVFATVIPFTMTRDKDFGGITARIPYDDNSSDPLMNTYDDLASLGELHSQLLRDPTGHTTMWSTMMRPTIEPGDIQRLLGHTFQGYILGSVAEMQTPRKLWSYDSARGASLNVPTLIAVPDEQEYPVSQIKKLVLPLKDVNLFSQFTAWHWKLSKLKVPRGTSLTFTEQKSVGNSVPIYLVHFQRQPDFTLDFVIEYSGSNHGETVLPPNFVLHPASSHEVRDVYSYGYAISMNFRWNGDHVTGQPYAEWAENLFNGLQKRFVVPEH
jgi:hypothetical protein